MSSELLRRRTAYLIYSGLIGHHLIGDGNFLSHLIECLSVFADGASNMISAKKANI